ncbi:hypothetical protein [Nocardia thailandica]
MTVSTLPTSLESPLAADGEHARRVAAAQRRGQRLRRLLSMPPVAVAGLELAWIAVLLLGAVPEISLIEPPLSTMLPTAGELLVRVVAIAYLAVYSTLWHLLGSRVGAGAQSGLGRRAGLGWGSAALAAILVATLVGIAVRRALSLADSAGRRAVSAAAESGTALDADQLDQVRGAAWWAAFWPDLAFTVSLMGMLAALAVLAGAGSVLRHEALSLHLARLGARRAAHRAAALDAEHRALTQRVESVRAATAARDEHATELVTALHDRFARAAHLVRHHIAQHQGTPEATTTIAGPPPR